MYIGAVGDVEHVLVTAGHCVGLGDEALVVFNFEDDADGPDSIVNGVVLERSDQPDYGLIALDADPEVAPVTLGSRLPGPLAVVQHPRGRPKVFATGAYSHRVGDRVFYADIDTEVGSSGAGVFNQAGRVVAIHAGGDCQVDGTNWGYSAVSIARASEILAGYRFDDC